jgi:hypothetical protein
VSRLLVLFCVAVLAAVLAPLASAATYTDTLRGVEVAFSSTEGTFTGTASGSLPGTWTVVVDHTPLSSSGATITGGDFTIETVLTNLPTLVTGALAQGGTVTVTNPGFGCTNQKFAIYAPLVDVGRWYGGAGTGLFTGTLTHYRYSVFGRCITYSASISGSVTVTF